MVEDIKLFLNKKQEQIDICLHMKIELLPDAYASPILEHPLNRRRQPGRRVLPCRLGTTGQSRQRYTAADAPSSKFRLRHIDRPGDHIYLLAERNSTTDDFIGRLAPEGLKVECALARDHDVSIGNGLIQPS
jgi:hypothetical protein